jgi:hypothetical protein
MHSKRHIHSFGGAAQGLSPQSINQPPGKLGNELLHPSQAAWAPLQLLHEGGEVPGWARSC